MQEGRYDQISNLILAIDYVAYEHRLCHGSQIFKQWSRNRMVYGYLLIVRKRVLQKNEFVVTEFQIWDFVVIEYQDCSLNNGLFT